MVHISKRRVPPRPTNSQSPARSVAAKTRMAMGIADVKNLKTTFSRDSLSGREEPKLQRFASGQDINRDLSFLSQYRRSFRNTNSYWTRVTEKKCHTQRDFIFRTRRQRDQQVPKQKTKVVELTTSKQMQRTMQNYHTQY